MLTADQVTACLVTRGDQPEQMERIIATLPYGEVIVWDNSVREDFKTHGRYMAAIEASNRVVYFQDDDTLFTHHEELMAAYEPGMIVATYGHGENDGGYGDIPLVGGGALADSYAVLEARKRYYEACEWGDDEDYYCDFAIGVLVPFKHVDLPFAINMGIAQHPSRLCNQPWAADAKLRVTERARAIRDGALSVA